MINISKTLILDSKKINKEIEKKIKNIYNAIFNEIYKKSKNKDPREIKKELVKLSKSSKYEQFCKKFAVTLAKKGVKWQKDTWLKLFKLAKKEGIIALKANYNDYEKKLIIKQTKDNFRLIKSLPKEIEKIIKQKSINELFREVALGKERRGHFESFLRSKNIKNARLIARTEVSKMQTALNEQRSRSLKSVCYIWRTSNDKRVRKSHRNMMNVVVFWRKDKEKPCLDKMFGNAGEFPNCRCRCEAIVIPNIQLKNSNYKVYNYKIQKIVTLTKKELFEKIEKAMNKENPF